MSGSNKMFLQELSIEELKVRLTSKRILIVDVRRAPEIQEKRLKQEKFSIYYISVEELNRLADTGELNTELNKIPNIHEAEEIFTLCRSGMRSLVAAAHFRKCGFKTLSIKGGILGMETNGFALEGTEVKSNSPSPSAS